ncbi:MAG: hypothetical protein ACLGSH_01655 [Acidobacteriota bacterium]
MPSFISLLLFALLYTGIRKRPDFRIAISFALIRQHTAYYAVVLCAHAVSGLPHAAKVLANQASMRWFCRTPPAAEREHDRNL